jgi:protocatechuate 3,4-dioxygenase beta subunit
MGNRTLLALLVVAAVAAVFFLLGGGDLFAPGSSGPQDGAGGAAPGELTTGGAPGTETAGGAHGSHGPVLFGRARAQRTGRGSLQGLVMDFRSGKPVTNTTVTLAGSGYGGEKVAMQAHGDARGFIALTDVPAGDGYALQVVGSGGRQRTLPGLSVDAGGLTDVGTVWLGKRGVLRGVVVDERGTPVDGARVQVHAGSGSILDLVRNFQKLFEELDKDAVPLAHATTNAKGRFEIPDLDPGPMVLVVRAPGHLQALQSIVMTSDGAAGGEVKVRLRASTPFVGVVVDEDGRGVAGARVACLQKNDMKSVFFGRQYSETDAAGHFHIDAPPTRGSLAVIVSAAGYPTLFTEAEAGREQRFVLVSGTDLLVRVLEAGTEAPVQGARLTAMIAKEMGASAQEMSFVTGLTDAAGEAHLRTRPGTLAMLLLSHPRLGNATYAGMGGMGMGKPRLQGPKDSTIGPGSTTMVFHVAAGIRVSGRVTDPQGAPVAGARCSVMSGLGSGNSTLTDEDGRYELDGQSPPVMMVLVTKPGYVQKMDQHIGDTAAGTTGDVSRDVVLEPAASVVGRVVGPDHKPVGRARVKAAPEGNRSYLSILGADPESLTTPDGRYVLTGVAPGKLRVMARAPGFQDSRTESFEVKAGGATQAPDLGLRRASALRVEVRGPSGAAVAGARVEVSVHAADRVRWDTMASFGDFADEVTGADGQLRVRDVPDGQVTVTVSHEGQAPARAKLKLAAEDRGTEKVVRLALREGLRLGGRVLDGHGDPVAQAIVAASAPPEAAADHGEGWVPERSVTTDARGRFVIADLPGLDLQVHVKAKGYRGTTLEARPGGRDLEVRLEAMDAGAAARLQEIGRELMQIYGKIGQAKDDAERKALLARMRALQKEKAELQQANGR